MARDRANKDWPSKPGLSVAEQKAELMALLDRAAQLKLNAIIFQVRPSSDAVYASAIEPWSEYLTGMMGRAPQPFMIRWPLPSRRHTGADSNCTRGSIRSAHCIHRTIARGVESHFADASGTDRKYGDKIWLDPGEPSVRAYVSRVVMDVVQRYDVDGVQFDDYFYPYPEKDAADVNWNFPTARPGRNLVCALVLPTVTTGGVRTSINSSGRYQSIKAVKPWVKFGVSPFGIWRPMIHCKSAASMLTRNLRRFTSVARQRLAGLFCAATLLGGGAQGAKFSRVAQLVDATESQGPASLAGS